MTESNELDIAQRVWETRYMDTAEFRREYEAFLDELNRRDDDGKSNSVET